MSLPLKVAVVERDRDVREFLRKLVGRLGYQVVTAEDGPRLAELCRSFGPDLILADLGGPELERLTSALERQAGAVPVVLMAERPDPAALADGAGTPVVGLLAKPVRGGEVRRALEMAANLVRGEGAMPAAKP